MTETDWLTATNPRRLLELLRGRASDRKLRLFACACCRRVWERMRDERSRRAVEVAERYADGLANAAELEAACFPAQTAWHEARAEWERASKAWPRPLRHRPVAWTVHVRAREVAMLVTWNTPGAPTLAAWTATKLAGLAAHDSAEGAEAEQALQSDWLRDLFGNPFHSVRIEPIWLRWHDECVVRLARAIDEEAAFDRLPILHDALLDAGCDDETLLEHCRQPEEHIHGCWVIDRLLGNE
jgi:hypothetical protein